jgi:hypothetical protein
VVDINPKMGIFARKATFLRKTEGVFYRFFRFFTAKPGFSARTAGKRKKSGENELYKSYNTLKNYR